MNSLSGAYYQIPANYQPPPIIQEYSSLVTEEGEILTDLETGEQLFAFSNPLNYDSSTALPFVLTNDRKTPLRVKQIGKQRSEVAVSLLGIPRESNSQLQYAIVNTYAIDPKEFDAFAGYNYNLDPAFYWQQEPTQSEEGLFGVLARHLPGQACIQAYAYPPPASFPWAQVGDSPPGYFPGGRSNGVMKAGFSAIRVIRYQPGKICRVTLGIKATGGAGGIHRWGVRNQDGDGYYFELEDGVNFYLVRTTPGKPDIRTPRRDWNGDPLDGTKDLWVLRPDKVTMYQIEYGWYGAIGAKFMALVPFGAGPESGTRWIRLHSMDWLDSKSAGDPTADPDLTFTRTSLQNPFMRLFVEVTANAGVKQPQTINLYGSSAYIEGDDSGTKAPLTAACQNKPIDTFLRSVLGIQIANTINNIPNQRIVVPQNLTIVSTENTIVHICMQGQRRKSIPRDPIDVGYGLARKVVAAIPSLSLLPAATLSASRDRLLGDFTSVVLPAPNQSPMQLKLEGVGLNNVYVVDRVGNGQLILNRQFPPGFSLPSTISMNPFAARAISVESIPSGVTEGRVYCDRFFEGSGAVRVGLWPSNGRPVSSFSPTETAWGMLTNTFVSYNSGVDNNAIESGGLSVGNPINSEARWRINAGQLIFNNYSVPMLGFPLFLVAEFRQGGVILETVLDYQQGLTRTTAAVTWQSLVNATVIEPSGGAYVTPQFNQVSEFLSGALVDVQGNQVLESPKILQTFFLAANTPHSVELSRAFAVTRQFLSQSPSGHLDGFFVAARITSGTSALVSAYLSCDEE